jgi:hypothetical protein
MEQRSTLSVMANYTGFWNAHLMMQKCGGKRRLLAVVIPCKTEGKDATKVVTEYNGFRAPIVTDLQAIQQVVGHVQRRNTWCIIDRSTEEARPIFISGEDGHGTSERIVGGMEMIVVLKQVNSKYCILYSPQSESIYFDKT